jgi:hypothetical protein
MTRLEELKKEMVDALEAYELFKLNNSRELTEDEKENEPQYSTFSGDYADTQIMELTRDKTIELVRLEQNVRNACNAYVKESKL